MLLARKSHALAMHGIPSDEVQDLGVLFTRGAEGASSSRHVVEEVLDLDLRARTTRTWLWLGALAWFWRREFATCVVGFPCDARCRGATGNREVGDVADAGERLAAEAIGADGSEVLESLEL